MEAVVSGHLERVHVQAGGAEGQYEAPWASRRVSSIDRSVRRDPKAKKIGGDKFPGSAKCLPATETTRCQAMALSVQLEKPT